MKYAPPVGEVGFCNDKYCDRIKVRSQSTLVLFLLAMAMCMAIPSEG
jgi:hypothetical protein